MQKTMIWAVALALAWGGVLATPVVGQDVIQIKVGKGLIDDPNKETVPVPEFTFELPLLIEIEWVEPAEGLQLTLSDFRLVSFDPDPGHGEAIWPWDPDFEVQLLDLDRNPIRDISFSYLEADRDPKGAVTRKSVILERTGDGSDPETPQLILFKQTLSQVLIEIDPPWVGKPPVG